MTTKHTAEPWKLIAWETVGREAANDEGNPIGYDGIETGTTLLRGEDLARFEDGADRFSDGETYRSVKTLASGEDAHEEIVMPVVRGLGENVPAVIRLQRENDEFKRVLAGIENPASALKLAREALEGVVRSADSDHSTEEERHYRNVGTRAIDAARRALAALGGTR